MKVVLKKQDGKVFKLNECAKTSEKENLQTRQLNNEKVRRESINDEVLLQLLKKNNFQNNKEMKRKFEDFLLSSV